jgi:outer membrane protein
MNVVKIIQTIIALLAINESAFGYDITDAINATLQNNTQLKASAISLEGAKLQRFGAATSFLPAISGQITRTESFNDGLKSPNGTPRQNALSISEEIFSGGKGIYGLKASKFISEAALISYQNSIDNAIIQTVQLYETVIALRDQYKVYQQQVELLKKVVNQSEVKLSIGTITRTDMLESKASLAKAIAANEKSYADMRNAEENFKYFTGENPPKDMKNINIKSLTLPSKPEVFLDEIDSNNLSIKVAEKNLLAQKYATKSTKAMMLPTVTGSISAVEQDQTQFNPYTAQTQKNTFKGTTYQLSVNIPIFQKGTEYVQIKKALLDEENALNGRNDAILKAQKDAVSAWNSYSQAKMSVTSNSESVGYYKVYLEGLEEEFKIGTKTLTELLQGQQKYENARNELIQTKANMVISALNLKYLLGQIKSVDFSKLVSKDKSGTNSSIKVDKKEILPSTKFTKVTEISTAN